MESWLQWYFYNKIVLSRRLNGPLLRSLRMVFILILYYHLLWHIVSVIQFVVV